MSLYGTSSLYGAELYGNPTYITTIGTQNQSFLDAQKANIRQVTGFITINSYFQQYGRAIEGEDIVIGGTGKEKIAQSFIAPRDVNISEVQVMMKTKYAGNVDDINIGLSIGTDISTATVIGSTTISPLNNFNNQWQKATFDSVVSLLAGSTYWIIVKNNADTEEINYASYDLTTTGDFNSAKAIGTVWGTSSGSNYITRIKSEVEVDNDKQIAEAKSFNLIRDVNVPVYSFSAEIVNQDQKYSQGQIFSDYMEAGNEIKAFIGFHSGTLTQYYQIFRGFTENNPSSKSVVTLTAKDYMSKMLGDYTSSGGLGGKAYEDIIQNVAERSGISNFDLRVTGKTSAAVLSFSNKTTSAIAEQVREATLDRMQFYNDTTLTTTQRAKKTTTNNIAPDYYINHDDFLIDGEIEINTDKMVNRITVTNDENGETTGTTGTPLIVGDYRLLGTGTISLGSDTASGTLGIVFSHGTEYGKPTIFMDWSKDLGLVNVEEKWRSCGNSSTYGSIAFDVYNKKYGVDSGTTTISVYGCPISNAGTSTILVESFAQDSYEAYGKYSKRVDNKIFANTTDAGYFATECLNEYSEPISLVKMNTRGIVDVYPDDLLGVYEPTRLKLSNLCITKLCELNWTAFPASFNCYIEAEKTPYGIDLTYLLAEDGSFLLQENGDRILL